MLKTQTDTKALNPPFICNSKRLDYYAYGSAIIELSYAYTNGEDTMKYRYGFSFAELGKASVNGQEQDKELGDYYAFEYRIHDARLGRFLSVDPLGYEFPYRSPYQFAGNQVITSRDLEGLEAEDNLNLFEEVDGPGMMDDGRKNRSIAEPLVEQKTLEENDPIVAKLNKLVSDLNTHMNEAWNTSHDIKNPKLNDVEFGAAIIFNSNTGVYASHKYSRSRNQKGSINLTTRMRDIPKGWELVGDFHTHPYSSNEILKQGFQNFDGNGMAFSQADFGSVGVRLINTNHMSIVEAGTKRFAFVVTNRVDFRKFKDEYSGQINQFFNDIDIEVNKRIEANSLLNYADVYWEVMVEKLIEYQKMGINTGFSLYVTNDLEKKNFI